MAETAGDVRLANAALSLLGEASLANFSEPADLARTVGAIYADTVRGILGSYPWRFTMRKAQLSRLSAAPINEWRYQHELPADCLALRGLRTSVAVGGESLKQYEIFGTKVLSDAQTIWADYQASVAPELWPPLLFTVARHALASDLAVAITGSASLAELHAAKAYGTAREGGNGGLMAQARLVDSQQEPPQRIRSSRLLAARRGGG